MVSKLERVPVKIMVTLEFDRPEFPMLATRLAMSKRDAVGALLCAGNSGNDSRPSR